MRHRRRTCKEIIKTAHQTVIYAYDGNVLNTLNYVKQLTCYENETYSYEGGRFIVNSNNSKTKIISSLKNPNAFQLDTVENTKETKRMIYNGNNLNASDSTYSAMFTKDGSDDIGINKFEANLKFFD